MAAVAACTAAAVVVLSPATNSKAIALAGTLAAVVITGIVIMGIGVVVHLLVVVVVVVVIIRASAAHLFAVVGKATPILTFLEVGDMMAAPVPLAPGTVLWRLPALWAALRAVEEGRKQAEFH